MPTFPLGRAIRPEGNTITRVHFMRLRRLTREALSLGRFTPQLKRVHDATFTHFLDLPILFPTVSLGTLKPEGWALFIVGSLVALAIATTLALTIPRLYPWAPQG